MAALWGDHRMLDVPSRSVHAASRPSRAVVIIFDGLGDLGLAVHDAMGLRLPRARRSAPPLSSTERGVRPGRQSATARPPGSATPDRDWKNSRIEFAWSDTACSMGFDRGGFLAGTDRPAFLTIPDNIWWEIDLLNTRLPLLMQQYSLWLVHQSLHFNRKHNKQRNMFQCCFSSPSYLHS